MRGKRKRQSKLRCVRANQTSASRLRTVNGEASSSNIRQVSELVPEGFRNWVHPIFLTGTQAANAANDNECNTIQHGDCPICLEEPTQAVTPSNCVHVFCLACLRRWKRICTETPNTDDESVAQRSTASCPICKTEFAWIRNAESVYYKSDASPIPSQRANCE